jgi:ankyrin repeat protein
VPIVEMILKLGKQVDCNVRTKGLHSALHCACENNHIETVKMLLKFPGIDVNIRGSRVCFFAFCGEPHYTKLLLVDMLMLSKS